MQRRCLIFGDSDLAEVLCYSINFSGSDIEIVGFVVDDMFYNKSIFCGEKVYKYSACENEFDKNETEFLIGIGYKHMNSIRRDVYNRLKHDGWKIGSYIDKCSNVRTDDIGEGTLIFEGVNIGVFAKIGKANIFYPGSLLAHHSVTGDFSFFAINASVAGFVSIGNECFLGNNSCTKDKIQIADRTLIGAGCYIDKDITKTDEIYVPQKCIRL